MSARSSTTRRAMAPALFILVQVALLATICTGVGWALGVGRIGSIIGPVAGGLLLGAGWSAQSVVLVGVVPALLAAMAVVALRSHGPLPAAISSAATLQH